MKLNSNGFALSLGAVSGIFEFLCGALIGLFPAQTTAFASWWFHIDITGLARPVTFSSFIGSIVVTFVVAYVFGWALAELYNRIVKE